MWICVVTYRNMIPDWAHVISLPGGRWRRWWLHTTLRVTAKRMHIIGANIAELRARQAGFDHKFGRIDHETRATPIDCAGAAAEWIDVPESRPNRVLLRVLLYLHGGAFVSLSAHASGHHRSLVPAPGRPCAHGRLPSCTRASFSGRSTRLPSRIPLAALAGRRSAPQSPLPAIRPGATWHWSPCTGSRLPESRYQRVQCCSLRWWISP